MKTTVTDRELISRARAVACNAHAPYSNFRVGTAVETVDGSIFLGCNVENGSYGLTICAERAAIAAAVASGHTRLRRIAIAAGRATTWPCGACLQVIAEFGGPATRVVTAPLGGGAPKSARLSQLLPRAFAFKIHAAH